MTRAGLLALACLLSTLACQTSDNSNPPPTTPDPGVTENFSGTVNVGGSAINPFTVALSGGLLTVTLTSAGPPANVVLGMSIGMWDGTTCTPVTGGSTTTAAGSSPQLSGSVDAGKYCVSVYDPGNLGAAVSFAVRVTHY